MTFNCYVFPVNVPWLLSEAWHWGNPGLGNRSAVLAWPGQCPRYERKEGSDLTSPGAQQWQQQPLQRSTYLQNSPHGLATLERQWLGSSSVFIGRLFCAKHCVRCWGKYKDKSTRLPSKSLQSRVGAVSGDLLGVTTLPDTCPRKRQEKRKKEKNSSLLDLVSSIFSSAASHLKKASESLLNAYLLLINKIHFH